MYKILFYWLNFHKEVTRHPLVMWILCKNMIQTNYGRMYSWQHNFRKLINLLAWILFSTEQVCNSIVNNNINQVQSTCKVVPSSIRRSCSDSSSNNSSLISSLLCFCIGNVSENSSHESLTKLPKIVQFVTKSLIWKSLNLIQTFNCYSLSLNTNNTVPINSCC